MGRGHDVGGGAGNIAVDGQRRQSQPVADAAGWAGRQLSDQRCSQTSCGVRCQRGAHAVGVERMGRVHHRTVIGRDRPGGFRFVDRILTGQRRQVGAAQWFCHREVVQHRAHRRR